MVKRVAIDRPLSFEEVGVIGAGGKASDVKAPLSFGEARAQARPASAGPIEGMSAFVASGFDRVADEEEAQGQRLPEGYENWEAFKKATGPAKENFVSVILFPEFVFTAPGRYLDAQNFNRVFDVVPGEVSPKGLYLMPINYILPAARREVEQRLAERQQS